jgi:uncharacterized protein YjiS (DUF1127 family)
MSELRPIIGFGTTGMRAAGRRTRRAGWRSWLARGLGLVEAYRARRALLQLSPEMLRDIGLDRADIDRALAGPAWEPVDWAALDRARRHRRH